jgi:hypothetical protein
MRVHLRALCTCCMCLCGCCATLCVMCACHVVPLREFASVDRLAILTWRRAGVESTPSRSGSFILSAMGKEAARGCVFAEDKAGAPTSGNMCPYVPPSDSKPAVKARGKGKEHKGGKRVQHFAGGDGEGSDEDVLDTLHQMLVGGSEEDHGGPTSPQAAGAPHRPKRMSVAFSGEPSSSPPSKPNSRSFSKSGSKVVPMDMDASSVSPRGEGDDGSDGNDGGGADDGSVVVRDERPGGQPQPAEGASTPSGQRLSAKQSVASSGMSGTTKLYHRAVEHDAKVSVGGVSMCMCMWSCCQARLLVPGLRLLASLPCLPVFSACVVRYPANGTVPGVPAEGTCRCVSVSHLRGVGHHGTWAVVAATPPLPPHVCRS